jgi:hypothetical protein
MDFDLLFAHPQNAVGTEFYAVTTVDADHRFVGGVIPLDCPDEAGLATVAAADALFHLEADATAFPQEKGISGAYSGTGRITTGSAYDDGESTFHAAD